MIRVRPQIAATYRAPSIYQPTDRLRLHASERDTPFSTTMWSSFVNRLQEHDIRYYPDSSTAIAELATFQALPPECITVAEGSDRILKNIFECFAVNGVLSTTPAFPMYEVYSNMYGATYHQVRYVEQRFPFAEFSSMISTSTNLVIISNPCSPVGDSLDSNQISYLQNLCIANSALLVIDEAYIDFSELTSAIKLISRGNLIVVRTFSKGLGSAGVRIGYSISDPKITAILRSVKAMNDISSIAVIWMKTLLDHYHEVSEYVLAVKQNRMKLELELTANNIEYIPSQTNFVNMTLAHELPGIITKRASLFDDRIWTRVSIPGSERNLVALISSLLNTA